MHGPRDVHEIDVRQLRGRLREAGQYFITLLQITVARKRLKRMDRRKFVKNIGILGGVILSGLPLSRSVNKEKEMEKLQKEPPKLIGM